VAERVSVVWSALMGSRRARGRATRERSSEGGERDSEPMGMRLGADGRTVGAGPASPSSRFRFACLPTELSQRNTCET